MNNTLRSHLLDQHSFLLGSSCPEKLIHAMAGLPRTDSADPFLAHLAAEKKTLVALARMRFPEAHLIPDAHPALATEETARALRSGTMDVFEGVAVHGGLVAKVDIARCHRSRLELFLVRAAGASWSEYNDRRLFETLGGSLRAAWRPAIEEAAFVFHVFASSYPSLDVATFLIMPDQDQRAGIDGLPRLLRSGVATAQDEILRQRVVRAYEVTSWCKRLRSQVAVQALELVKHLCRPEERPAPVLRYRCRKCEFRTDERVDPSGFRKCWGALAEPDPHLFELYQLWSIKNLAGGPFADDLIKERKTSLFDVPMAILSGEHGPRQRIQIRASREGREWIAPELTQVVQSLDYPLHFVDFETITPSVPHHAGMAPFDTVAFQWSCHTLKHAEGPLEHREWLNDSCGYPNVDFVRSLRRAVGDRGTLLIWTAHETTTLAEIAEQIADLHPEESELVNWVRGLVQSGGRVVDLNALCLQHYYHPENRGRSSLKKVLPPIWRTRPDLWNHPFLAGMGDGTERDPYECLPAATINLDTWEVREGCGAMQAYKELVFGLGCTSAEAHDAFCGMLLRYCRLDTLAMVLIWLHWSRRRRHEIELHDAFLQACEPDPTSELEEGPPTVSRDWQDGDDAWPELEGMRDDAFLDPRPVDHRENASPGDPF